LVLKLLAESRNDGKPGKGFRWNCQ